MGNGIWTVEIIPAEIQPPPRLPEGASGNRIRLGAGPVTNWGDETNLVVAFNEQVLLARHRAGALARDAILLVEDKWAGSEDEAIRVAWTAAMAELSTAEYRIIPVPMEERCLTIADNPRKGKNMFALGLLVWIYRRDLEIVREQIVRTFRKKSEDVFQQNLALLQRVCLGGGGAGFPGGRAAGSHPGPPRRHERQRSARHGCHRSGHGALRHVSDHAGHLGVALSE